MDRATKLFVVLCACLGIAGELWLVRSAWPQVIPATIVAAAAAAAATSLDRRMVSAVLVFAYLFPALIKVVHGQYHGSYEVLWAGALLGAMAPDAMRTPWHVPAGWRPPLACSALIVIGGAFVVIGREMDFYPGLLFHERAGGPAFMAQWVLRVAQGFLLGILWFDWLLGARGLDFRGSVATPLAAGALVMAGVACYQLFVDITFLNNTVFGQIARASGTMLDANVCGTLAAMWIGGALLWADRASRWRPWLMAFGASAAWLTVWATGSRTAFAAAVIVSAFSGAALFSGRAPATNRKTIAAIVVLCAIAAAIALPLLFANATAVGPMRRFWSTLPAGPTGSIRVFLIENLWVRNGYGSAATAMIRQFPWFGVGLGSFQTVLPEFAMLPPDNAQNWYRHQLAELGVVGSLGWAAWLMWFGAFVFKRREQAPQAARIARGILVAFGAISFVGMPGQDLVVAITLWTAAYWFVSVVGPPPAARTGRLAWGMVLAVVSVFIAGSLHAGQTTLRPPVRAVRMGTPYEYGFYPPERNGAGGAQRWARKRAVAVVDASGAVMELSVSVNHLDVERHPVDVLVWVDGRVAIDTRLASVEPVRKQIAVPRGRSRVLLQTWVSRVLKPSDFAVPDGRELGLLVAWKFGDGPSSSVRDPPR